jgi:hypothetical protein
VSRDEAEKEAGFTCRALWAVRDSDLDSADFKVVVALISCCVPLNGSASVGVGRPSLGRLATAARTSRAGVRRSLARLEAGTGPLRVQVERGRVTADGDSDSHRYTVTVLAGCDQANPTPDQANPTPDQAAPTVGPPDTDRCDHPDPTGVTTQTHFEDLSGGSKGGSEREPAAVGISHSDKPQVFFTDAAGTRSVDSLRASFAAPEPVAVHAFEAWAKAFGKSGVTYDSRRAAVLTERVRAGMSAQDADDAIAGALADDYVTGKKDGKKHDRLTFIFGDDERYVEFRDAGREQRERSDKHAVRKVGASAVEEQYRAEREATHAAAAARLGDQPEASNVRQLIGGIGG